MKVRRAIFSWKNLIEDTVDLGNMKKLDIVFVENQENPSIFIDAGYLKIEDNMLKIDCKDVLKKIGEINFDEKYDSKCPAQYSGDAWEITVNDKTYKGVMEDPHYVIKAKKIIRFSAIKVYAEKKLAGYIKS